MSVEGRKSHTCRAQSQRDVGWTTGRSHTTDMGGLFLHQGHCCCSREAGGGDALFWEGTLVGVEAENPLETVARRQEATELNRVGCGHWSLRTDESQGSWGGDPELNPCSGSRKEA